MGTQSSLPLSTILNVAVVVSPAAAPGPNFNQALIVGSSTVIPTVGSNSRLRLYFSLSAMEEDGFSTTSNEHLAAELYFGQEPSPTYLWVGRQNLSAIGGATVGASGGTGCVPGDTILVVQAGATGGCLQVATVGAGGVVTGLALISNAQGNAYSVANNLATTGGSGTGLEVDITGIGETPAQAVEACRLANPQWYCVSLVATAADSDLQAMSEFIEAAQPPSVHFLTTGDAAVLNGTPGNLLANLKALNLRRTFSVYSTTQGGVFPNNAFAACAPMGYAMGANTGATSSYFDLMFKALAGVAPEPLTQTQVNLIAGTVDRSSPGLNGNLFLNYANGAYQWIQNATMSSGVFFDEVLFLDMLASDMQTSGVNLLTSVPALPITDAGVLMMKNVLAGACERSQAIGFIAPSGIWEGLSIGIGNGSLANGAPMPNGYFLYAPPVSSMSSAQRAARILPAITAAIIESESGHSLQVTVQVQQ